MSESRTGQPPEILNSRAMHIMQACVMGTAVLGFFVGINRANEVAPVIDSSSSAVEMANDRVAPATSYPDLQHVDIGPNSKWSSSLTSLEQDRPTLTDKVILDPTAKARALAARSFRRAYNGAPPVVPHAIDQFSSDACLACHQDGLNVQGQLASAMPHPYLTNCTQCHVEAASTVLEPYKLASNSFAGKPAPFEGVRAWQGAPPVIPHTMHMRDSCLACHGPSGPEGMRTTHSWRTSCPQCHAPSDTLDQRLACGESRFLPPLTVNRRPESE